MCTDSRRRRLVVTVLCTTLIGLLVCIWPPRHSVHPQFGRVYRSAINLLSPSMRAALWVDRHSSGRTRLAGYVRWHVPQRVPMLTVTTNKLYCGAGDPVRRTWLALYVPPSTNGIWEFARCGRTNLMEVTAEDLNATFVRLGDPLGTATFATDWATTAVRVSEGEIVFARRVRQSGPIYVIRFTHVSPMKIAIQYAVVPTNKPGNHSIERTGDSRSVISLFAARWRLPPAVHAGCQRLRAY